MKYPFLFKGEERVKMERRKFLKWMGMAGIGLSPLVLVSPVKELIGAKSLNSVSKTRPLMGTFVTVAVLDSSADKATEAMEKAFEEMERLIPLLSRHESESPVSFLNQKGYLKDIPGEFYEVMQQVKKVYQLTHGCFDITVKPILDLFVEHFAHSQMPPADAEIRRALKRVGYAYLICGQEEIHFSHEGMGISLDGIAKGFIVEKAIKKIKDMGIKHALINAGGDIQVLGDKGNSRPWKIAIQDPRERNKVVEVISLREGAIATSGDYENYFDAERKYHHIIDPQSGFSPHHLASVSVLSPSLTLADALATALFVAPYPEVRHLILSLPHTSGLIIDRQGNKKRISGLV